MKLASGLDIPNPERLLWDYIGELYRWYDGEPVRQDCTLSAKDIWLSRQLSSRITYRQRDAILGVQGTLRTLLHDIPPNVDLLSVAEGADIPGERALSALVTAMCIIPGVKLAKTTKVLHKKRPGLIPVLDSVIECHYWPKSVPSVRSRSKGDYALAMIRAFHRDMHSVADELRALSQQTLAREMPLTPCRILDILIWCVKTNRFGK